MSDRTALGREKLLFRYSAALERGDFETVAAVLELANDDAELERMILEMNEVYQAEMNVERGGLRLVKPRARRAFWRTATLFAVAASLILILGVGVLTLTGPMMGNVEADIVDRMMSGGQAGDTGIVVPQSTAGIGVTAAALPTMPPLPSATAVAPLLPIPTSAIIEVTPLGDAEGAVEFVTVTPVPPAPAQTQAPPTQPGGEPLPTEQRLIIKNGELRLLVEDTDIAIERITQIAVDNGGYVLSSQSWMNGPYKAGNVQIAVRSENFETAMRRLRDIAIEVLFETSSGVDVSEEYVDLQSRLRNLEATRDRLKEFLDDAQTVDEAIRINNELAAIEGQIEQVKGRMQFLSGRAAYSTIRIDLEEPGPTPTITPTPTLTPTPTATFTPTPWSLGPQIKDATRTQTRLARGLLSMLLWLVIVPGPYLAGGVVIWLIVRQVVRKRGPQ